MKVDPKVLDGADITLAHAKTKLAVGSKLTMVERLGAMAASATKTRGMYGPTPADAEPVEIPLPETVKGAIANARG